MSAARFARILSLQDRLASLLGGGPDHRSWVLGAMLASNNDAAGYWLKLLVAVGISTLGLVVGSTAVVIGAMLIAPLMTPLVNLGMGLAVGSPFLVLRSTVRVIASVAVTVGCSSVITRLLPFNELNPEIASRTTPTALDLFVAAFCALAGVLAVIRRDSDIASTAAGTSIGISLVPPLCVSGYGVGTASWSVASGALLLFLTNFVAIVVVSSLSFAATGFNQADIRKLEAEAVGNVEHAPVTRRLAKVFASRGGPWLRLLMPLALLAAVYVPLRQGLDEVVWQIRARKEIDAVVAGLPYRLVQSRAHVERRQIELTLVLLGTNADALRARSIIELALRERTGISPRLEVSAIPDAAAFAGLQAALHRDELPPSLPPQPATPAEDAARVRSTVQELLDRRWPVNEAGPIASVSIRASGKDLVLEIVHLGASLDGSALELLARVLTEDAGGPLRIVDRALPRDALAPAPDDATELVVTLAPLLESARATDGVFVCVIKPAESSDSRTKTARARPTPGIEALNELLKRAPRVTFSEGPNWRVQFALGPCPDSSKAPTARPPGNL